MQSEQTINNMQLFGTANKETKKESKPKKQSKPKPKSKKSSKLKIAE